MTYEEIDQLLNPFRKILMDLTVSNIKSQEGGEVSYDQLMEWQMILLSCNEPSSFSTSEPDCYAEGENA